jgi:hypothetical protein
MVQSVLIPTPPPTPNPSPVYAYMIEHRNAVREKLVDQEAEGLRKLNLGRDQILARLWELANLSHEVTRGIIAGQIKALSMIVAIEGLIPDRRLCPSETRPVAPPEAEIYTSEWRRKQLQDDEPSIGAREPTPSCIVYSSIKYRRRPLSRGVDVP